MSPESHGEDVVIVGAGPAGIAAAIQLRRHGLSPLVFERRAPGGLLEEAHLIENYPGLTPPVPGPELAARLGEHLRRAEVRVEYTAVTLLDWDGQDFQAQTASRVVRARIAVVATGTRARDLPEPPLPAAAAPRIHTGVTALRGRMGERIAILGAGDAAFDYALNLSRSNAVTILGRGPQPRCLPLLRARARAQRAITYRAGCRLARVAVAREGHLLLDLRGPDGSSTALAADHLLLAIGREPELGLLSPGLRDAAAALGARGVLQLIGDVGNGDCRQAAVAAGQGIAAAMRIAARLATRTSCAS